jgi:hypothetical protein
VSLRQFFQFPGPGQMHHAPKFLCLFERSRFWGPAVTFGDAGPFLWSPRPDCNPGFSTHWLLKPRLVGHFTFLSGPCTPFLGDSEPTFKYGRAGWGFIFFLCAWLNSALGDTC